MMAEFRKASNEFRNTIESEVEAEKIRDSMRLEPPKVEPSPVVPSAPAAPAIEPAPAVVPTDVPHVDTGAGAAPSAPPPTGDPVPETISRQPAPTPIEPR
jgi:hypothetical protein